MSEIRYVNRLGDELERAARLAVGRTRRARRRRFGLLAVAAALVVSGSALAAGLLSGDPEIQAATAVACYDGADSTFSRSTALVPHRVDSADVSAVELCRREGLTGPLVACGGDHGGVAVVPGRSPARCEAAGFVALAPAYDSARRRVARLERRILAIEESADCIPPGELARRVQRLLDRSGWKGWSTEVARTRGEGPCGTISVLGGDGRRYISLWPGQRPRTLRVARSAPRRITELLYSAERSLLAQLIPESGGRCFSYAELSDRIREVFATKGVDAAVRWERFPASSALDDEDGRWTRYQAGCAIVAGGSPGATADSVEIPVFQKR